MSDIAKGITDCLDTINKLRDENTAQAARIAELEAALTNARREWLEEAAKKALIIASVLSDPSAQNALRSFAEAIRAELKGGKK